MRVGAQTRLVYRLTSLVVALLAVAGIPELVAQQSVVRGRVAAVTTGAPVAGAIVSVEGADLRTICDSAGAYVLVGVRPGPQVLLVRRIGFARARAAIVVPPRGEVVQDVLLAETALALPEITVTADPVSRARGELGTASVIDREAIANQSAASLAGLLELVPGVPLQPPGLDGVQQFAIRSLATSPAAGFTVGGPSAADLGSLGTLIVLDGVPLSNNANLQSAGPRGEVPIPSSSGGGVDLRRIPAATLERVEVVRGIPSARYGDLTQGVIVVDTRAGVVPPAAVGRVDAQTLEGSLVAGRTLGLAHTVTATADVAHTLIRPAIADDDAYRLTLQLSHRATSGGPRDGPGGAARFTLDSRADFYQVQQESPERPEVLPGSASSNHDRGLRLAERARLLVGARSTVTLTTALDYTRQRSAVQMLRLRGGTPFTDRVDAGRAVGHFVIGQYLSRVRLEGAAWQLYSRLESETPARWMGLDHRLLTGAELRREWNTGSGYLFDVEFPPQVTFNGVQGFDRPYRFDAVPPVATTGLYVDDRMTATLPAGIGFELQAGLRVDVLHRGTTWLSGVRDGLLEPRVNAQLTPWPWLRVRAGIGRTAKSPSLASLYPAPQYFDVVNVNWFTNDPDERLAILTTSIRDPTNPDLGFSIGRKQEAGVELELGRQAALALVAFRDGVDRGIGFRSDTDFLLRDHYDFVDSTTGTGRPPTIIEPAASADIVPILLDRPANNLTLHNRGYEATLTLPELSALRLRLSVQGALVRTEFLRDGPDFGRVFSDFQLSETRPRSPYWENVRRKSERALVTYRLIHHQPQLGLVVTVVLEHSITERREDFAATDTLAFAGYITRDAQLVPVPPAERGDPQYADLRVPRTDARSVVFETPADWMMSLQVAKSLPLDGRLSLYAFNAFDRLGRVVGSGGRSYPRMRFGLEVTMPLGRGW